MLRCLSRSSFLSGMLAALVLAGMVTLSDQPAVAQTGNSCHLLTSSQDIPQGFGAAYNLFSVAKEVLIAVTCDGTSANITLGSGAQTQYIYKKFYRWDGSAWVPREWRHGGKLVDGTWYVGSASDILNSTGETDYFVAYICQWIDNDWKCGCRDTSCTTNHWQLQAFRQVTEGGGSTDGGTLVYRWSPKAEWTALPLTQRRYNNLVGSTSWWREGASVGESMVKSILTTGGDGHDMTFNRAPTGQPSLELYTRKGIHSVANFSIQLYEHYRGAPRHLRTVIEFRTSDPGDPTTYKSNGIGPTAGKYPNWGLSSAAGVPGKFLLGMYAGGGSSGGCRTNWWKDPSFTIDRAGYRVVWASGGRGLNSYDYVYDRMSQCGAQAPPVSSDVYRTTNIDIATGQWNRLDMDVFLTTPSKVPANARLGAGEPSHTGDGFVKLYYTSDIDGEKGASGERQLLAHNPNLIFFPRDKDRHINANLGGPWINLYYGGSQVSSGEAWVWIRKIEVYEY